MHRQFSKIHLCIIITHFSQKNAYFAPLGARISAQKVFPKSSVQNLPCFSAQNPLSAGSVQKSSLVELPLPLFLPSKADFCAAARPSGHHPPAPLFLWVITSYLIRKSPKNLGDFAYHNPLITQSYYYVNQNPKNTPIFGGVFFVFSFKITQTPNRRQPASLTSAQSWRPAGRGLLKFPPTPQF